MDEIAAWGGRLADGSGSPEDYEALGELGGATLAGVGAGAFRAGVRARAPKAMGGASKASDLPRLKPGTKAWDAAVSEIQGTTKGKLNYRTETASDARRLLRAARGNMDRRKQYTQDTYRGYLHKPSVQICRTFDT